jgi:hypothetical protein
MRKLALVLTTLAAITFSALPTAQPARADGGAIIVGALALGWLGCAVQAHPWCWWQPKPAAAKPAKKVRKKKKSAKK